MERLSLVVWWLGEFAIVCLAYRAWRGKLYVMYPYFYAYFACMVGSNLIRAYLYNFRSGDAYKVGYWISEFAVAVVGFGVTWEIFLRVLSPYRGVQRMARTVLAGLFVLILGKAGGGVIGAPIRSLFPPTTAELERNLRVIQALLLLTLLGLIVHYAIPTGRNVRLMLLGYGMYVGTHVIVLSLRAELGNAFRPWFSVLPGFAYCVTLIIWCVGMWSLAPNPMPDFALEHDYERITAQTVRAFGRLRNHLIDSWKA